MKLLFSLPLLVALLAAAHASAPDNQVVLNLEPTVSNPRNSEGSFATLKSGRIIFCYSQFYGGHHDESPARIAEISSDDQGQTWSASHILVDNGNNQNVMSVTLLRLASGKLALFYAVKRNSWIDCRPYMQVSADDGATWSERRPVGDAPGFFVLNNDRVIQTESGRLIVPVAQHRILGTVDSRASWDQRPWTLWYLSDDEGIHWREAQTWWAIPIVSKSGLQEPGVVQLADGSLFSWSRTDQGEQYGFRSSDNGETWSAPEPTELKSPVSPASIRRLPHSSDLLAIYNDHSGRYPFPPKHRTPLIAAISHDGGRTWPQRRVLENDPNGWYCYTAIHFVGDQVLLGYCAGDYPNGLDRLRIRRVELTWFKAEQR
jgi:sialidase-1